MEITTGDIISYVILPQDLPTNPQREYTGKVIAVYPQTHMMKVALIDLAYKGFTEMVYFSQISRKMSEIALERIN